MCRCLFFTVFCSDVLVQILAKYGAKLSNVRSNLVQSINVNEFFLADMMYHKVLSPEKKRAIQAVCDFFQDFSV